MLREVGSFGDGIRQARADRPPRSAAGRASARGPRPGAALRPSTCPLARTDGARGAAAARSGRSPAASGSSMISEVQRAADPLVELGVADRDQPGQQQAIRRSARTNASVTARTARLFGSRIRPRASPSGSLPIVRDQTRRRARRRRRGATGMVKTAGPTARRRAGQPSASAVLGQRGSPAACRRRTTGPGGPRRSAARLDRPVPQQVGRERSRRARRASSRFDTIWMPVKTNGATRAPLAAAQASGTVHVKVARPVVAERARHAARAAAARPSFASSHCDASSFIVSAGPSIHRLSLLSARNGSQSISGARLDQPAARFHQQARARRRSRPQARAHASSRCASSASAR